MDLNSCRHAFVSGGASGIGLGIARALAGRGLRVTIADINTEALSSTLAENESWLGLELDTRDRAGWAQGRAAAEAQHGPVDVLVNNAGIAPNGKGFTEMDPESFDRILAINLVGVANGVFEFAPAMRERGLGHIVNTSSQAGLTASILGVGAYAVAKYGVTALSESLRTEMAAYGIGVTCLCPGYVATNLAESTKRVGGDVRSYAGTIPPSGIDADDVGAMVLRGIEDNAAFVITHPDVWPSVEQRMAAIREACTLRQPA